MNIKLMNLLLIAPFFLLMPACNQAQQEHLKSTKKHEQNQDEPDLTDKNQFFLSLEGDTLYTVVKTEKEWKEQLKESDLEYEVLRNAGTERAFTGEFVNNKKKGIYTCGGCGLPLFSSDTKYKSGSGWPSYYQPIVEKNIKEVKDDKFGWNRVEILCARCDGHLGHVFEDGPQPTGLRYCVNSISLDFVENK